MTRLIQMLMASFVALYISGGSAHQIGEDPMGQLDADLEAIRNTEDPAKRKEMLLHHLHLLTEQLQTIASFDQYAIMASVDDDVQVVDERSNEPIAEKGPMGLGQSITNIEAEPAGQGIDMIQHQLDMVKIMEHMLVTQELILGLIDRK